MAPNTIDHRTLARLVEGNSVRAAHVVGQPGGWGIVVREGTTERRLAATRSQELRIFRKMETVVGYLKGIGINRFDVDAADYDPDAAAKARTRPDTSAALKRAHLAAEHDRWFRAQVAEALEEADDPTTVWVSDEDAKESWAKQRAELLERARRDGS